MVIGVVAFQAADPQSERATLHTTRTGPVAAGVSGPVDALPRVLIDQLAGHDGRYVRIAGWVHRQRKLSRVTFLLVRDGWGVAQVVIEDDAVRASVRRLRPEDVVEVFGRVTQAAQAPGGFELRGASIIVMAPSAAMPPLDLGQPTLEGRLPTILDHAAFALRHPGARATFRLSAASMAGFRGTLDAHRFTEICTPKIVSAATETGANVFTVDYFGRPAFLAQSPQLYKQTMVGVFERVYEIGPVFRAEPHDTTRHLAEYVSMDVETAFVNDHWDLMALVREVIAGMAERCRRAIERGLSTPVDVPHVPDDIPVVSFNEALALIHSHTGGDEIDQPDLAPPDERWLGAWARRERNSDFLFVEGYPMSCRPFYTHPDPKRPGASRSFDLLFRGVELVTGGQRLHRHVDYLDALGGRVPSGLESYVDTFKCGMPPHGGFAIGLERWIAGLTRSANIRSATLFPRDNRRLTP